MSWLTLDGVPYDDTLAERAPTMDLPARLLVLEDVVGAPYGGMFHDVTGGHVTETARFDADDVASVERAHISYGDYAEEDVFALVILNDGRYAACEAWCDTTGFDCQSNTIWSLGRYADVTRFGMSDIARERLGIVLDPEAGA